MLCWAASKQWFAPHIWFFFFLFRKPHARQYQCSYLTLSKNAIKYNYPKISYRQLTIPVFVIELKPHFMKTMNHPCKFWHVDLVTLTFSICGLYACVCERDYVLLPLVCVCVACSVCLHRGSACVNTDVDCVCRFCTFLIPSASPVSEAPPPSVPSAPCLPPPQKLI